nr:uncharacterized protein LOC127323727 [Lolium perenne]
MAPPPQTTPRRSEGTGRCVSSSSTTWFKESTGGSLLHRQIRRFFSNFGDRIRQFRSPPSSSACTVYTSSFRTSTPAMLRWPPGLLTVTICFSTFSRTHATISPILARPISAIPEPVCKHPPWPRAPLWSSSKGSAPVSLQHSHSSLDG